MIQFNDSDLNPQSILEQYQQDSPEYEMTDKLIKSMHVYKFTTLEELTSEITLRKKIIDASYALYKGRLAFRTFQESKCNEDFWERRTDGGFVQLFNVTPADAIRDIFQNTRRYGTECATAIVILYYKAVLDVFGTALFNSTFRGIILMNWQQMDDLLGVITQRNLPDYIPGDCRYFKNPEVNPLTPEWQGENAIDLGNGKFYGHGIGIGNSKKMIYVLNQNRIEDAQESAFLMETATRLDFTGLYKYKKNNM